MREISDKNAKHNGVVIEKIEVDEVDEVDEWRQNGSATGGTSP
jgi:hypothetical protein